jgi:hypothetical protein
LQNSPSQESDVHTDSGDEERQPLTEEEAFEDVPEDVGNDDEVNNDDDDDDDDDDDGIVKNDVNNNGDDDGEDDDVNFEDDVVNSDAVVNNIYNDDDVGDVNEVAFAKRPARKVVPFTHLFRHGPDMKIHPKPPFPIVPSWTRCGHCESQFRPKSFLRQIFVPVPDKFLA